MIVDLKYNSIGKDVKVTLPDDLDTYKELLLLPPQHLPQQLHSN